MKQVVVVQSLFLYVPGPEEFDRNALYEDLPSFKLRLTAVLW
jgi:hypothetical protein